MCKLCPGIRDILYCNIILLYIDFLTILFSFIVFVNSCDCHLLFPRDALVHSAVLRLHVAVCLSVYLSVTLVDQDHIG